MTIGTPLSVEHDHGIISCVFVNCGTGSAGTRGGWGQSSGGLPIKAKVGGECEGIPVIEVVNASGTVGYDIFLIVFGCGLGSLSGGGGCDAIDEGEEGECEENKEMGC